MCPYYTGLVHLQKHFLTSGGNAEMRSRASSLAFVDKQTPLPEAQSACPRLGAFSGANLVKVPLAPQPSSHYKASELVPIH